MQSWIPGAVCIGKHDNTCEHHHVNTSTLESKEVQHIARVTRMIVVAIVAKYSHYFEGWNAVLCNVLRHTAVDWRGEGKEPHTAHVVDDAVDGRAAEPKHSWG